MSSGPVWSIGLHTEFQPGLQSETLSQKQKQNTQYLALLNIAIQLGSPESSQTFRTCALLLNLASFFTLVF